MNDRYHCSHCNCVTISIAKNLLSSKAILLCEALIHILCQSFSANIVEGHMNVRQYVEGHMNVLQYVEGHMNVLQYDSDRYHTHACVKKLLIFQKPYKQVLQAIMLSLEWNCESEIH